MNRKIFTLLASALMLFSTAFYANARSVADKSVGALVKTLPSGLSKGMYHIQVDSLCLSEAAYVAASGASTRPDGSTLNGASVWVPVTYDNGTGYHFEFVDNSQTLQYQLVNRTSSTGADTLVLSITEGGQVVMVSAPDLRDHMRVDAAGLTDLQAAMWCTNVVKDPSSGQWPTFHFTNKIYNKDLDYAKDQLTTLGNSDKGWMYSNAYENEQLNSKQPLYRHFEEDLSAGKYTVITAELNTAGWPTGKLYTKNVPIDQFVANDVVGMLKLSIVKISPFVLNAKDFNTQLYNTDGSEKVQLTFDPVPTQTNYFGYKLKAYETSTNAANLGYLNVQAFDQDNKALGYIRNSNQSKTDDPDKYNNKYGTEYLNITYGALGTSDIGTGKGSGYNYSYRFVYFPSEDSLVINAYHVKHDSHNMYGNSEYTDVAGYISDPTGVAPYYYGLYTDNMLYALIVRLQDLTGYDGVSSLMTIASHPSNVRIYFGVNSCEEMMIDAWQPAKGVYTIWDSRGRCLGVRIYNGSYTPQWMELYEGECPDRIPAYQWVIEPAENSPWRINITNREFGNLAPEAVRTLVAMQNVLVYRGSTQIFEPQSQFIYSPIVPKETNGGTYEPITKGWVTGQYLDVVKMNGSDNCGIGGGRNYSGFRPVINEFLSDTYLGYKHFSVDKNTSSVSYGKSEDSPKGKGMDYNAYAFNYLHQYYESGYITLKSNYTDSLMYVDSKKGGKTGFQFMLGTYLRSHQYEEEVFGYPRGKDNDSNWKNLFIADVAPYFSPNYTQKTVPTLKRYYYELKVADFYKYRNGLAEQFVVLKGAKADNSDIKNALKYGVADVWADKDPFKFANVYLRESFFLPRPMSENEERNPVDMSRRIYYVMLDRIEAEQLQTVTAFGLQVSDTLMGDDGTSKYNLVQLGVDDKDAWIKAVGKTGNSIVVSPFALENMNYPLYRRLRSKTDDNATEEGDGVDPATGATLGTNLDAPKTLRIYRDKNSAEYLFEDALSDASYGYGINFLGLANSAEYPEQYAADGLVKYNYHLFIDTAFINRGTGWIKPQYLIAVGQTVFKGQTIPGTDACGDPMNKELIPYVVGRYLVNATDSARAIGSDGSKNALPRDARYIYDTDWDRLAFVPAIHTDDRLYIISELRKCGINDSEWTYTGDDGKKYVDGLALRDLAANDSRLAGKERKPENSAMYGAFYDFGTWDNYHNDVCFSLRFTTPDVQNPDANGNDTYSNFDKRFFIESETTNRTPYGNRKIAPVQGGWIKLQNWVPVLSRTSYADAIQQAEIFNVEKPTSWQDGKATSNENVTEKVSVIAGEGSVSVLNAAGKQVVISNMLGQTVVNKALVGNNETVSVSKGVVIVTVEGEKAVKVIVK